MSAEGVAKYAYNCLKKNKAIGIPGIINRLMQLAPEHLKMRYVAGMKGKD
jgi:short-subunit dehydrogenase